jgi:hypothetical protein
MGLCLYYYYQLPSVESKHYDVVKEVFSEICDDQMLELTRNYRAENNVDFKEFITDSRIVKNGGKPDFKTYGRKSLCLTNKTRKSINYKWMQEETKDNKYTIIINFKVFVGLLIICKKTKPINQTDELKNNKEFVVIN